MSAQVGLAPRDLRLLEAQHPATGRHHHYHRHGPRDHRDARAPGGPQHPFSFSASGGGGGGSSGWGGGSGTGTGHSPGAGGGAGAGAAGAGAAILPRHGARVFLVVLGHVRCAVTPSYVLLPLPRDEQATRWGEAGGRSGGAKQGGEVGGRRTGSARGRGGGV